MTTEQDILVHMNASSTLPVASPPTYLILIDSRVSNYQEIINAKQPGVYHIVFDVSERTTYYAKLIKNIEDKIAELGVGAFTAIGLVQHNDGRPIYEMFGPTADYIKPKIHDVQTIDPEIHTWNRISLFITMLRLKYGIQYFDMMACALYSNPDWKYVIDKLTSKTGVTIRASIDDTGAAALGGDWFLESHTGVNLKDVYFTGVIENYDGILVTEQPPPPDIVVSSPNLILIDHTIPDIPTIINSLNDNTYCLVFNRDYDTYESILSKLRFLYGENRYILDDFYYAATGTAEEGPLETPAELQSEANWPFYEDSTNITIRKPVFFQRMKAVQTHRPESESNEWASVNVTYVPRGKVRITDLDEIYEIAKTAGEVPSTTDHGKPLRFGCVGILQHAPIITLGYKLTGMIPGPSAVIENIQSLDANLSTWSSLGAFITALKTTYHITTLDFMACAVYANPDWKYIIDNLAVQTNITIRASHDNTGTVYEGANWILESADINLTAVYFTELIYQWSYILPSSVSTLRFDGVDDAVNLGIPAWTYSTQFRSTATIECWFRTTDTNTQKALSTFVSQLIGGDSADMFSLHMKSNGRISFWIINQNMTFYEFVTTQTYNDTVWHHVAVTFNSANGDTRIYIDGSLRTVGTAASLVPLRYNNTITLMFGSDRAGVFQSQTDRQFRGSLSDIRMWNVVRTATEISTTYQQRLIGNETGLMGYWKMNQGYGSGWGTFTVALDSTFNRVNGTLTNFASPSASWVTSTLEFTPRISNFILGPKNGVYNMVDSSFSFIDPSSNSLGTFSYTINNGSATIANGAATTKVIYSNPGPISIPTLNTYDFPMLADITNWQIDMSFTVTGGSGTTRALIGDMYSDMTPANRGWGMYISNVNRIYWTWLVNDFNTTNLNVSLNTPYLLSAIQNSGILTLTLTNITLGTSITETITVGSNILGRGPVTIGGWRRRASDGYPNEDLPGTISYVNVSVPTVFRNVTFVSATSSATSIAATQDSLIDYGIGTQSASLTLNKSAPTIGALSVPSNVQYGQTTPISLTSPTSNVTRTSVITSTASAMVPPTDINALVYGSAWTKLGGDIDGEATNDESGCSVAISADGTIVAIGAKNNDGSGNLLPDSGHVRVYKYTPSKTVAVTNQNDLSFGPIGWTRMGADIDGEGNVEYSGFGVAISADGMTVAIGAHGNDGTSSSADNAHDKGGVRVYRYDPNKMTAQMNQTLANFGPRGWNRLGEDIDGEAIADYSGLAISLSADGTVVAIGAASNDGAGSNAGHVRVYKYTPGKGLITNQADASFGPVGWTRLGRDIDGEAAADESGYSVALSADGTIVAIGARYNDGSGNLLSNSGHVRVYQYTPSKTLAVTNQNDLSFGPIGWNRLGADIDGEGNIEYSGWSVALSADGTTVAIGAVGNDANSTSVNNNQDRGNVRVYRYDASKVNAQMDQTLPNFGPRGWNRLGEDIDGEAFSDYLGWSVSLSADGNIVACGGGSNDGDLLNLLPDAFYLRTGGSNWRTFIPLLTADTTTNRLSWGPDAQFYSVTTAPSNEIAKQFSYFAGFWLNAKRATNGQSFSVPAFAGQGSVGTFTFAATSNYPVTTYTGRLTNYNGNTLYTLTPQSDGISAGQNSNFGHVRVFQYNPNKLVAQTNQALSGFGPAGWDRIGNDIDGEAVGDESGTSVRISSDGTTLVIGAFKNDGPSTSTSTSTDNRGHVRVYNIPTTNALSYSSSNSDVADICGNLLLIKSGVNGSSTITASQTGNTVTGILDVSGTSYTLRYNPLTFTSANASVATVTSNGTVSVVGAGTTSIRVDQLETRSYTSGFVTANLVVSGIAPTISAWTISDVSFGVAPFTLTAPSSNSNGAFVYSNSTNTGVATVTSGGVVTVVGAGSTTFTATQDASGNYTSRSVTGTLTVRQVAPTISAWTISEKRINDISFTLTAPSSNSNGAFTYSTDTSGSAIATVTSNGVITLTGVAGTAVITATQDTCGNYTGGSSVSASLVVNAVLSNFTVPSNKVYADAAFDLTDPTTIYTSEPFIFTSSNTYVASIGGAGGRTVTIHKAGSTIITAKQLATGAHPELTITAVLVIAKKTPVITLSSITKNYGDASFNLSPSSTNNDTLGAGHNGDGLGGGLFSYTSSNNNIISIFDTSNVSITGVGSALIIIDQSATMNFTSGSANVAVTINKGTPILSAFTVSANRTYGSAPFSALAYPTSVSDGVNVYSSLDSTVATIDSSSGIITLLKAGYVNFTATQAATAYYNSATKTSNTMTVYRQILPLTRSSPTASTINKTYGDSYFTVVATNASNGGTITYETDNPSVAGIVGTATAGVISVVSVGTAMITARRGQTDQYESTPVSWTVEVARTTTTLTGLTDLSYNVTTAPFTVSASSASDGAVTYSLQDPSSNVLTIHPTTGLVTLRAPGSAVIVASQAQGTLYLPPASITATITVTSAGNALQGATITSTTSFAAVNLEGASLAGVSITNTAFTAAKLTNANLTNAVIVSANFASADLSGATLAGATITGATFTAASLKNADLSGAVLTSTAFTGSDLSGARLTGVDASGASFANAKLTNVDMTGANIANVNFTNTSIKGANIADVSFSPLQKLQLLKNSDNRDIGQIIIPAVTGTTVLAAISETSPLRAIENLDLATATVAVVVPTTSTSPTDVLPDVVLNVTDNDKFYLPINESEFFQIEGVKYYATGGVVRNYLTNAVVEVISYNGTPVWLLAGSIVGLVLQTNALNSSSFIVPSRVLLTTAEPFMPTTLPTSNHSETPIVYSSSNTNIATIDPSSGQITVTGNAVGFVHFTASQIQNATYEPGVVVSNTMFVDRSVHFTLTGLNQTFNLSTLAMLDASSILVDATDATAVFYVRLSDINNVFKYQSDSADITNIAGDDIKYYVFHRKWPTELKLNPSHAMMDKTESAGMQGSTENYASDKSLLKHDFIRYIALRLFNTIHGVDLIHNESELQENAVYLGETVRHNIDTILSGISTTSSSGGMSYDASGNKYLTNDASGNTNLCRELMRQIAAVAPSRFYDNVANLSGLKNVPFVENDTIQYKLIVQAASGQNLLTGVSEIPSRSYTIKLIIKNTVNSNTNTNTATSDSEMFANSYPYSSSVVTYAPTTESSGVYNIYSPPAPIPFSRFGYNGWYYANSVAWVSVAPAIRNHIKWLVGANTATSKVADLQYIRFNLKIHNSASLPYLMIYTQAGSWRKYAVVSGNGSLVNGTLYSFYMNFNSYATEPLFIGHTNAPLGYTVGNGSFANSETIASIAIESDSNAAASNVEFTLSSVVVGELSTASSVKSEKEYGFEAAVPAAYP